MKCILLKENINFKLRLPQSNSKSRGLICYLQLAFFVCYYRNPVLIIVYFTFNSYETNKLQDFLKFVLNDKIIFLLVVMT